MASRIKPVAESEVTDLELKELLAQGRESWWEDVEMFGVIGQVPDLLKSIVPVFVSFFAAGRIDPHIFELMRLKTGQMNDCAYWQTVRTAAVRSQVEPHEHSVFDGKYDSMTKREALAVELAERIAMDPHSVTDEFWQDLKTEFNDKEIVELVYACGIFNWGNKFNITMRLDTDDKSEYPVGMEYKELDAFWRKKPA